MYHLYCLGVHLSELGAAPFPSIRPSIPGLCVKSLQSSCHGRCRCWLFLFICMFGGRRPHASVCERAGMARELNLSCLSLVSMNTGLLETGSLTGLGWLPTAPTGICPFPLPQSWNYKKGKPIPPHMAFFHGCLGVKLKATCLCDKHLTK